MPVFNQDPIIKDGAEVLVLDSIDDLTEDTPDGTIIVVPSAESEEESGDSATLADLEQRVADIERDHQDNTDFVTSLTDAADNEENDGKVLGIKDGMVQPVSGAKVIDLTKYIATESYTFNDLVLSMYSSGGGAVNFTDSSSFWADVNTDETIKLVLDISALASNTTIEAVPSYIMKQNDTVVALQITIIINGGKYMRGSILFETVVTGSTTIVLHIETLDVQEL